MVRCMCKGQALGRVWVRVGSWLGSGSGQGHKSKSKGKGGARIRVFRG